MIKGFILAFTIFLALSFILIFSSFSQPISFVKSMIQQPIDNDVPEGEKVAIEIINKTAEVLAKKYSIHPCGIGMTGNKLEHLSISFEISRPLQKDELRMILIDGIEEFLRNINSNKKISPYLKNFPFNYNNVGMVFFITDSKGKDLFHPDICVAHFTENKIIFRTNDPNNEFKYKENSEESHEEAITIVNKQKYEKIN